MSLGDLVTATHDNSDRKGKPCFSSAVVKILCLNSVQLRVILITLFNIPLFPFS